MSRPHLPDHFTDRFLERFSTALATALHHREIQPPRLIPPAEDWDEWHWEDQR